LTVCRLPWIELGLSLEYYPKLLTYATGVTYTLDDLFTVGDRIYTLIRAFWIREYGGWSKYMDYPPMRWFKEPLTKGPYKGQKLDLNKYDDMLRRYYHMRGWDSSGIPTRETLEKLGLGYVVDTLSKYVEVK